MNNLIKKLTNEKVQLLIIIVLILLAYSDIFHNSFQGDDWNLIINWDFIHHIENIPKILTQNVLQEPYFRFRPLGTSLIAIYYHFFGSNPLGYHIFSIITHVIKTILIFFVVKTITKNKVITFVTALIFAVHPVETESVTHVIVSLDSTGYIFYLASFLLYL